MSVHPAIRAAIALSLSAAVACLPPAVTSDRDEAVAIPQGASWAWAPPDTTVRWERDADLGNEITHQRFVRAIEAIMAARGFHEAGDVSTADFLLTYHMGGRRGAGGDVRGMMRVGFSVGGGGWGRPYHDGYRYGWDWPGWGWGVFGPPSYAYGPYVGPGAVPYRSGALFILLRHRESGDVAWQVRYALDPSDTHRVSPRRVQEIVDRLFEDLR